ncbi:acyltransferase family protein [Vibrio cyclitrophicus]
MSRLDYIDYCRGLALLSIIFAHTVGYSGELLKIRTFDVCFFVLISGYVTTVKLNLYDYFTKRSLRLVKPVWFFLTVYFSIWYLLSNLPNIHFTATIGNILGSYLLLNGIGFVWVIRVFMIVGFVGYISQLLWAKTGKRAFFSWVLLLAAGYFVTYWISPKIHYWLYLEPLPYLLPYFLGILLRRYSDEIVKRLVLLVGINIVLLVTCFTLYVEFSEYFHKYPPSFMYIIYGCCCSLFLLLSLKKIWVLGIELNFLRYLGINSMALYLWHIPMAKLYEKDIFQAPVLVQFFSMIIFSVVSVFLMNRFILFLKKKSDLSFSGLM